MNDFFAYSLLFIGSALVSSISQVLLKKSAGRQYSSWIREYLNPLVIVAYLLFFSSTLLTMYAYVPLSFGPMYEATGYIIFVSLLGPIFLWEKLSRRKLLGLGLIIIGAAVFSIHV